VYECPVVVFEEEAVCPAHRVIGPSPGYIESREAFTPHQELGVHATPHAPWPDVCFERNLERLDALGIAVSYHD